MAQTAESIGANVFQFFTRNPRGGAAKPIDKADVAAFLKYAEEKGIKVICFESEAPGSDAYAFIGTDNYKAGRHMGPILAHAPYTLNAAGAEPRVREFAEEVMVDDLKRLELTPGAMYNFHPGSHVGQGTEKGIELIAGHLNRVVSQVGKVSTTILLETMAGKGSEVGRSFEEIRAIIDAFEGQVKPSNNPNDRTILGVCLDTCHVWDGGYDIVNDLDGVLSAFDKIIGLDRLKAIHINDSMNVFEAHKDRHEKIGKGKIGLEAFGRIVNHPKLRDLPFYLETPCDLQGYKEEIALLKGLRK